MALNIPAAVTALNTELGRVRTSLGFANDAAVDAALASIAAIQASADKLAAVVKAFRDAQNAVSGGDPG